MPEESANNLLAAEYGMYFFMVVGRVISSAPAKSVIPLTFVLSESLSSLNSPYCSMTL